MSDVKTINAVIDGEIYGTYRCSEKKTRRALSMFVFMREPNDSLEDLKANWDQVCDDHGLRYEEATNFDLQKSVFSE